MALTRDHDLHRRRLGRNIGVSIALLGFAGVVFGITVARIAGGGLMEAYDHQPRASLLPPVAESGQ